MQKPRPCYVDSALSSGSWASNSQVRIDGLCTPKGAKKVPWNIEQLSASLRNSSPKAQKTCLVDSFHEICAKINSVERYSNLDSDADMPQAKVRLALRIPSCSVFSDVPEVPMKAFIREMIKKKHQHHIKGRFLLQKSLRRPRIVDRCNLNHLQMIFQIILPYYFYHFSAAFSGLIAWPGSSRKQAQDPKGLPLWAFHGDDSPPTPWGSNSTGVVMAGLPTASSIFAFCLGKTEDLGNSETLFGFVRDPKTGTPQRRDQPKGKTKLIYAGMRKLLFGIKVLL